MKIKNYLKKDKRFLKIMRLKIAVHRAIDDDLMLLKVIVDLEIKNRHLIDKYSDFEKQFESVE